MVVFYHYLPKTTNCVWIPPPVSSLIPATFWPLGSALSLASIREVAGSTPVLLADQRDYQITCSSQHSLSSRKLFSCSLTHLSLSCLVILQVLSISGLLCSHTSSPRVSLWPCRYFSREKALAEVRTVVFARPVTAGLNHTSFHPFIFNRKSGLEVFAATFLQQVLPYWAVAREPPVRTPGWRSDLLLSVCCPFVPHLSEQVHAPVRSEVPSDTVQSRFYFFLFCVLFLI